MKPRFCRVLGLALALGMLSSPFCPAQNVVTPSAAVVKKKAVVKVAAAAREQEKTPEETNILHGEIRALDQESEKFFETVTGQIGEWFGPSFQYMFLGVEAWRYLCFGVVLILSFALAHISNWFLGKQMARICKRTSWDVDDLVFAHAVKPTRVVVETLGVYTGLMLLLTGRIPEEGISWLTRVSLAIAAAACFWYVYRLVEVADHYCRKLVLRDDNDLDSTFVNVARKTLRVLVTVVAFLFIARGVLQWNITTLVASAGIFGLAIAFAAQDTIANLFGTLMLLLDRPFRVGERVVINGAEGPVESIGFRSTRIRTLEGNLVSIPNKTAADSMVENVGRRPHIKRVSTIGLVYGTSYQEMKRAVEVLREIFDNHRGMNPEFLPRIHFIEFSAYSLDIKIIAWYHPGDQVEYWAWCEEINFEIMRRFEEEGLEFAFPTQTVHLTPDDALA
ncbi:MAG: mechanosensitive ion channel family protein [Lentisphaeria bacterium]|nr:mechanosensitive ion channel family protein [Lentisphaeria bacterium]